MLGKARAGCLGIFLQYPFYIFVLISIPHLHLCHNHLQIVSSFLTIIITFYESFAVLVLQITNQWFSAKALFHKVTIDLKFEFIRTIT